MKHKIYLAGPIDGLTVHEARHSWREDVAIALQNDIDILSPMRFKSFDEVHKVCDSSGYDANYLDNALSCAKGIVTRDRFDSIRCDLMILNVLQAPNKVSIGSMIELGWADANKVPIILVVDYSKETVYKHEMVKEIAGFIVPTVEDAIRIAKSILLPEQIKKETT